MARTLFLASQSPRRAALVALLGVRNVSIQLSSIDEKMDPDATPAENVLRLALDKSIHTAMELSGERGIVLGADTTVAIGGEILNKPRDADDAKRMLRRLSGATHTVFTGIALTDIESTEVRSFVEETAVTFRRLKKAEIEAYVASGSPMDKAGAYGIQEDFGAVFVRRIDGDYYNVVGLPLCRLYVTLKEFAPDLFS
jgi:septum formation protein